MLVYAQSSGTQSTASGAWTPIPGLQVTLPRAVGVSALLILNVPNPYATGDNYPGGNFGIQVNGVALNPVACFTYNEQNPVSTGRIPTTLCAMTKLSETGDTTVVAVWSGVRGSTVHIDTPATLSGIF